MNSPLVYLSPYSVSCITLSFFRSLILLLMLVTSLDSSFPRRSESEAKKSISRRRSRISSLLYMQHLKHVHFELVLLPSFDDAIGFAARTKGSEAKKTPSVRLGSISILIRETRRKET